MICSCKKSFIDTLVLYKYFEDNIHLEVVYVRKTKSLFMTEEVFAIMYL